MPQTGTYKTRIYDLFGTATQRVSIWRREAGGGESEKKSGEEEGGLFWSSFSRSGSHGRSYNLFFPVEYLSFGSQPREQDRPFMENAATKCPSPFCAGKIGEASFAVTPPPHLREFG